MLRVALLVLAATTTSAFVLQPEPNPREWRSLGPAEHHDSLTVRLSMKQRNLDLLSEKFWAVSDPKHAEYGNFMTPEQIKGLIAPSAENLAALEAWARDSCISAHELAATGDHLTLRMNAGCATQLFAAELHSFARNTSKPSARRVVRAVSPVAVPSRIQHLISSVFGLTEFPLTNTRQGAPVGAYPGDEMTPISLAKAYGVNGQGKHGASVAVAEFEEEYFYPSDIQAFLANYSLPTANISKIVGVDDPFDGDLGEASLDVQYVMGLSPGIAAWAWELEAFDLTAWALNVSGTPNAPKVHSISYGSKESAFALADMQRDNTEFMKLGLQGYSVLVASGDSGTGHDGIFRCKRFMPNFPGTSPYVTSVGGTYITGTDETGVDFSGGGFSTAHSMPSYQQASVRAYLSNATLPSATLFNSSGRAVPDVSASATNFNVLIQGFWDAQIAGTSASAPVWAAIVALLNDARFGLGKKPLGFLNPALYNLESVGRDVTDGSNQDKPCKEGFSAAKGWDPVTGLGSPLFGKLVTELVHGLP